MNVCSVCNESIPDGLHLCQRCSIALENTFDRTLELRGDAFQILQRMAAAAVPERQPIEYTFRFERTPQEHPLRLLFRGSKDLVSFSAENPLLIGRQAHHTEGGSFLNLESYDAQEKGVSRRHALLSWQDRQAMLCDLNSTNHTYINGQRLAPHRDYPLYAGDKIALGRLMFKVFFE